VCVCMYVFVCVCVCVSTSTHGNFANVLEDGLCVCSRAWTLAFVPACVWCAEGVGVVGGRFDVHVCVCVCVGGWGWVSACWRIRGCRS
jgi:hypothetical protein